MVAHFTDCTKRETCRSGQVKSESGRRTKPVYPAGGFVQSCANLAEHDKLRLLANYERINGRQRALDGSRSCLPEPGRKRARDVHLAQRRQGRLVPVLTE